MARLFDLNSPQLEAVKTISGPVLILAGAGTGKTRVIITRISYLLHQGADPGKILAVTFTNKAANEMRERIASTVERAKARKLAICTFHALCVRILRADIAKLGYKANFSIYDEADQLSLIRKIISRLATSGEKLDPNLARHFISKVKNQGLQVAPSERDLAAAVFHRYQEDLKTLNALDFDDLLLLAVRLLEQFPDVLAGWEKRFEFIMVDEFQDTNELQMELIQKLARVHQNVCVVGDDDQSIYGWRGAQVSNILEFERHFHHPTIIKLEQNYRSTNAILGAANSIIRHNPRRRPKSLWSENGEGDRIRVLQVPDEEEEANFVTGDIQRLRLSDVGAWTDFAVIFRMNAQSRLLEPNLRRLQIPYCIVGSHSFFERREVKDLLAYLSCIANPQDDISLLRIINTPARGIGASTIESAIEFSNREGTSLFEVFRSDDFHERLTRRSSESIRRFSDLIGSYETKLSRPLAKIAAVADELVREIGYMEDLRRSSKSPEEALNRQENVQEMIRTLSEYESRSSDGLSGFLAEMSLDRDRQEDSEADKGGVTLITFHAAKGLEFRHVFLVGIEESILPHARSKLEGSVDEERRLLYVGITRAMRTVVITHCANRKKYGSLTPCYPSSFLQDLDLRYTEFVDFRELTTKPASAGTARAHFAKMRELLAWKSHEPERS
jgi:superfamily I DNA/RNA helicase